MSTIAIVQARVGSTRLPGKVLADVAGQPLLWYVVQRTRRARLVDQVVVATPGLEEDRPIVDLCRAWGISWAWVDVDAQDVLSRYARTARFLASAGDLVVRITADCPLIDPDVIDATIARVRHGHSWASNVSPRTWPDGLDVEVMTYERLMALDAMTTDLAQREHVTPQLYAPEHLHGDGGVLTCPLNLADMRWTIDTEEDLAWLRQLLTRVSWDTGWAQLLFAPGADRRAA